MLTTESDDKQALILVLADAEPTPATEAAAKRRRQLLGRSLLSTRGKRVITFHGNIK